MSTFLATKDPDATLDYEVDWSSWLASGETISAAAWTLSSGLTQTTVNTTATKSTVWLSGGTANSRATAACRITTSLGRVDERTIEFVIRNR